MCRNEPDLSDGYVAWLHIDAALEELEMAHDDLGYAERTIDERLLQIRTTLSVLKSDLEKAIDAEVPQ